MNIEKKYIPINTKRRSGQKLLGHKFIVAHDTGNENSTALQNVNYFLNSANEMEASSHSFVDDLGVIECIPQDEKAWHVRKQVPEDNSIYGVDSNDYALGIELCFFTDLKRSKLAYKNYVEYIKILCTKYNLDSSKDIVGHYKLDPSRRTDPVNAFSKIGKSWDAFIIDLISSNPSSFSKEEIKLQIKKLVELL